MTNIVQNRYDFAFLFDVRDGNPNGDPDLGNQPRLDPETGQGLVTDVALKRKVRHYAEILGADIFIKEGAILERKIREAYKPDTDVAKIFAQAQKAKGVKKADLLNEAADLARDWMCRNFYDVRTFGAVMSTGKDTEEKDEEGGKKSKIAQKAGQVRGPVQITFARSVNKIAPHFHAITRMAVTSEDEYAGGKKRQAGEARTMGNKYTVPYGLYRAHGFVSAHLAEKSFFTEDDLELFWQALCNMFEHDRSAARGEMAARGLYVFRHNSKLGNCPANALFDLVKVEQKNDPARSFADFSVSVEEGKIPKEVTLQKRL